MNGRWGWMPGGGFAHASLAAYKDPVEGLLVENVGERRIQRRQLV
jgi:hypothetical protein